MAMNSELQTRQSDELPVAVSDAAGGARNGESDGLSPDAPRLIAPARRDDDTPLGDGPDDEAATVSPARGRNSALRPLGFLTLLYGAFLLGGWATGRSSKPPLIGPITSVNTASATSTPKLIVHVAGRVRRPGVYTLPADARVRDAVQRAGGPLRDADINAINLAAWAEDGTRIEVPAGTPRVTAPSSAASRSGATAPPIISDPVIGESSEAGAADAAGAAGAADATSGTPALEAEPAAEAESAAIASSPATRATPKLRKTKRAKAQIIAGMPRAKTKTGRPSDNASPAYLARHPLNLNAASATQLEALPGVGPAMARKILDYRAQNGGFKSVDELDEVPGIGEKKLETLRPLVTVK